MELSAGQTFGRYIIESVLGEGAMGRVYRASDKTLLRRVALKVLTTNDDKSGEKAADVLREARAAAAINHENAVTIFDVGEVEGVPFIAMEYISGRPLREFIGDGAVSQAQRVGWLIAVARALAAAHEKGLVHRDVKPENILIRKDGVVKVLDFGIAHRHALPAEVNATTMPFLESRGDLSIAGTPAYMAPEQLRGEKLDGRCDQFAWAIVAYEVLTGAHPFHSTQLLALMSEILTETPKPPAELNPGIPEVTNAVIVRALSKMPSARYDSMHEVVQLLAIDAPSIPGSGPALFPSSPSVSGPLQGPLATTRTESKLSVAPSWRKKALVAFAVVGVIGASSFLRTRKQAPMAPVAPSAIPITALEVPASSRLEAVAAYRAGLQSARDGAGGFAREQFARAAELDPTMVSANVMLAALAVFQNRTVARASLDRARQQRASLTGRDKLLLTSLEPLLDRDPADLTYAEKILNEGIAEYPQDAHLRLQLGIYRSAMGKREALHDADRALLIDPEFTAARLVRALVFEAQGEEDNALAAYEACVASSPASSSCLSGKLKLRSRRGECALVRSETKRWTTALPSDSEGYLQRAIFMGREAGSRDAVSELLRHSRSLLSEGARVRRALVDDLWLALYEGKFEIARARGQELAALGARGGGVGENGEAAVGLLEAAEESGNFVEAARIAKDFVVRRDLWVEAARIDQDPTPLFVAAARRANLLSGAEADGQRKAWLERWATRGRAGERWLIEFALTTTTPSEAQAALSTLPQFQPLPSLPDLRLSFALGKTYFLAGRVDEAIPPLKRAVEDCGVLRASVAHARAASLLGDAYRAKGQKEEACEAYGRVLERWKRGTTYTHVFEASRRLSCSREH
ncbi:MAG: protein kinase [Polyangiaceae bacterium]|nr:protein kinase [Polyangiaceae bacterium]